MRQLDDDSKVQIIFPDIVFLPLYGNLEADLRMIVQVRYFLRDVRLVVLARFDQKEYCEEAFMSGVDDVIFLPQIQLDALPMLWRTINRHRLQQRISWVGNCNREIECKIKI